MTGQAAKRFWKDAAVIGAAGRFGVALDGRPTRTPARAPFAVPTRPLAAAIAAEWQAQGAKVDPTTMPLTRSANTAIDKVTPQFDAVAEDVAGYGATDLTCYRADRPEGLVARQAAAWDPLIDWAAVRLSAPLRPVVGVLPQAQPVDSLQALSHLVRAQDAFRLTALGDLVSLSGSLLIGLAVLKRAFKVDDLWHWSRIDETWQIEQWGEDDEAKAVAAARARAFADAARFLDLLAE